MDITPVPTGTTFTFTMPENDVTVQAVVAVVGVPVKISTNIQIPQYVLMRYYRAKSSSWSASQVMKPNELERSHIYKLGLTLCMEEH